MPLCCVTELSSCGAGSRETETKQAFCGVFEIAGSPAYKGFGFAETLNRAEFISGRLVKEKGSRAALLRGKICRCAA